MRTWYIDKSRISRLHNTILERYRRYGPIYRETIAGETVVHLLSPDYIQTVYQNEGKIPYLVPLVETTQMYRRLRQMSPGLGNTYVIYRAACGSGAATQHALRQAASSSATRGVSRRYALYCVCSAVSVNATSEL